MAKLRLALATALAAAPIVLGSATPARAITATIPNYMVQVWSCAINVPGGACYRWYQYPSNGYYNPSVPSTVVANRYVYNRYQF